MSSPAAAQGRTQVFVDDSPGAGEALRRAGELAAAGNLDSASETLQRLTETWGDRLVAGRSAGHFVSIRSAVIDALSQQPALLAAYRSAESAPAETLLELGLTEAVERDRWLTPSGYEASLDLSQADLVGGRLWSAWRRIESLREHPDHGRFAALHEVLEGELARALPADELGGIIEPGRWEQLDERVSGARYKLLEGVESAPSAVELRGLLPTPVLSRSMLSPGEFGAGRPGMPVEEFAVVAPDRVIASGGAEVSCWDSLSLASRWRTRVGRAGETALTPAVRWPWVAVSIETRGRSRAATAVLDGRDGSIQWSIALGELGHPLVTSASPGAPLIEQDVVVVPLTRVVEQTRSITSVLAGLDLLSGELLWVRPVASRPFEQQHHRLRGVPLALSSSRGVVYAVDNFGVTIAVEARTGRPMWARRFTPPQFISSLPSDTWRYGPAVVDDQVVVVDRNEQEIVWIGIERGEVRRRVNFGAMRQTVGQLRLIGGVLVGMTRPGLMLVGPNGDGVWQIELEEGPATGPPVAVDNRLIVPTQNGLVEIRLDMNEPVISWRSFIDQRGRATIANDQLLVVSADGMLHAYMAWSAAERVLVERIASVPGDPGGAITLAEIAASAGRVNRLGEAVEHAVRAIEADPFSEDVERSRRRLFELLVDLIGGAPETDDAPFATLPIGERAALRGWLARIESGDVERATRLLLDGHIAEETVRAAQAVEAYQQILSEPPLSAAMPIWAGAEGADAGSSASARLRGLLRDYGRSIYAGWESQATSLINAELAGERDPSALAEIARRYPLARAAARAWYEAARANADDGRRSLAWAQFERALESASLTGSDTPARSDVLGEIVWHLTAWGMPSAAAARLTRAVRHDEGLPARLTRGGVALDISSIEPARAQGTWPIAGVPRGELRATPSVWLERVQPDDAPAVLVRDRVRRVALVDVSDTEPEAAWVSEPSVEVVAASGTRVTALHQGSVSRLIGLELATGEEVWRSEPIESIEPVLGAGPLPLVGESLEPVVIAGPGEVAVLGPSGAVVSFSTADGSVRWSSRAPIDAVEGWESAGDVLMVWGRSGEEIGRFVVLERSRGEVLLARDLGVRVMGAVRSVEGLVIALTSDGVVGLDPYSGRTQILYREASSPRAPNAAGPSRGARAARAGWSVPGVVYVHRSNGDVSALDPLTGHAIEVVAAPSRSEPVEDRRGEAVAIGAPARMAEPGHSVLRELGPLRGESLGRILLLAGGRHVRVLDASGRRRGEFVAEQRVVLPPAVSRGYIYVLTGHPVAPVGGVVPEGGVFRLSTLERSTGRLVDRVELPLGFAPTSVVVVEGALAISTSSHVFVIEAPADTDGDGRRERVAE
ncbi:MAG: PQQ-binding-like beta-propeller repeat protein [Planctomycetota bacterium]